MSNPNIKAKKPTTKRSKSERAPSAWFDEYKDLFSFKIVPINEAFIERFASDMLQWATSEDKSLNNLKITQFPRSKKVPMQTFYDWVNKHPIIKEAYLESMAAIGDRREIGGMTREYDSSMIKSTMHLYDSKWKESEEWRAKIKADADNKNQALVITNTIYKTLPKENEETKE